MKLIKLIILLTICYYSTCKGCMDLIITRDRNYQIHSTPLYAEFKSRSLTRLAHHKTPITLTIEGKPYDNFIYADKKGNVFTVRNDSRFPTTEEFLSIGANKIFERMEAKNLDQVVIDYELSYGGLIREHTLVCKAFYWKSDKKVIVSDFDGTVTISDKRGMIATYTNGQYAHLGVARLFHKLRYEYKFLVFVLTARSNDMQEITEEHLDRIIESKILYLLY